MSTRTRNSGPKDLAASVVARLKLTATPLDQFVELFECIYYASLRTEEARQVSVSVTYIDPSNPDPSPPPRIRHGTWSFTPFSEPIKLTVPNLTKLAAGADHRSSSIAVYPDKAGRLRIWGLIDQQNRSFEFSRHDTDSGPRQPGYFQAVGLSPGHVRVIHDYQNIAELKVSKLVDKRPDVLWYGIIAERLQSIIDPQLRRALKASSVTSAKELEWERSYYYEKWIASLCRLLLRMRDYRHGGALLIATRVPRGSLNVKYKIDYPRLAEALLSNSLHEIASSEADELIDKIPDSEHIPRALYLERVINDDEGEDAQSELDAALWFISLLSRVDGLVFMDHRWHVKGFGVEIAVDDEPRHVYIADAARYSRRSLQKCDYTLFGTRHRSMMRLCAVTPGAIGFVVSQDGDVRALTKVANQVVMWEDIQLHLEIPGARQARRGAP
jgi:hypothetical protein